MKLKTLALLFIVATPLSAKSYKVTSPDGKITAVIEVEKDLKYSITRDGERIIDPSRIALKLDKGMVLGNNPGVRSTKTGKIDVSISSPVFKRASVRDNCNQLTLNFKDNYSVVFRAYNDGVAYRFQTNRGGEMIVENEIAEFNFPCDKTAYAAYTNTPPTGGFNAQFFNSFENTYDVRPITQLNDEHLIILPLLAESAGENKVCITESDLSDYPGMFLNSSKEAAAFNAVFAPVVKDQHIGGHSALQMLVKSRENYIAKTTGTRNFPWRVMVISDQDKDFAVNDMVYRLAAPSKVEDISWIKPGKVAWDWWNDWNIKGVDFRAGINTETYKYYIDFASEHNISYVILDEGWSVQGSNDLMKVVPELNLQEIVSHGKSRNVDIILWAGYWPYRKDMEKITSHYSEMGVKGFKIDFMDRDDQDIICFLEQTAGVCANHKMLVDFHGTSKPAGIYRTWPNVINFEGVNGLEQLKWKTSEYDQVTYDLQIPFIRMLAGPMDYTQGAMRNVKRENYYPCYTEPMSQGTRCRQLAAYVIFESPLNMLCDAPTNYMQEKECTEFITSVPEVWDESVGLDSRISEYVAIARKSGDSWYVGAMTNWDERQMDIDLSFLGEGDYEMEIFRDGVNADRNGSDYRKVVQALGSERNISIRMMSGGGWVARFYKK